MLRIFQNTLNIFLSLEYKCKGLCSVLNKINSASKNFKINDVRVKIINMLVEYFSLYNLQMFEELHHQRIIHQQRTASAR